MALLKVTERLPSGLEPDATVTLGYALRRKRRLKTPLDTGEEVGLMLSRGDGLRDGDLLRAEDGRVIQVRAAMESVSTALIKPPERLAHAAYHLGNRHVPIQIGDGWLRYLADDVIDDMVRGLGVKVRHEKRSFEPEIGAYERRVRPDHVAD